MKRNYYFVCASLPPLSMHISPDLDFEELMARLQINLTKSDLAQVGVLRLFIDLWNIRALFLEEEIDLHGNLSEKELDEALLVQADLPDYVFDFLSQFERIPDRVRHFSGLIAQFFNEEIPKHKGFLKNYLQLERESRLVLVGIRAKALGRDLAKELQFEDPTDPFVAHLLAQKDADRYDPPAEYQELKEKMTSCYHDPWAECETFVQFRLSRLDEMVGVAVFSMDRILCYTAKLMLIEELFALDAERGYRILDTFKSG